MLQDRDGSATYESVKRRAIYWVLMNCTGRADWRGKTKERDNTMDTASSVDSGDTRQRFASRQRQCVTTVNSGDTWPSRAQKKEEERKGREKARGNEKSRLAKVGSGARKEREKGKDSKA